MSSFGARLALGTAGAVAARSRPRGGAASLRRLINAGAWAKIKGNTGKFL